MDSNLPSRRSLRLYHYDYSLAGYYFITICCHNKACRFGHIENDEMVLNEYGKIAQKEWTALPERFAGLETDLFQVMPNHVHGILVLSGSSGNNPVLGHAIGAYKSLVLKRCLDIYKSRAQQMGRFWQRNYYEHIIRDRESYLKIAEYIQTNPRRWSEDTYHV